jgi:predicted HAD superfamily Cof-like phosphohydrolase
MILTLTRIGPVAVPNMIQDVADFHARFGVPVETVPKVPDEARIKLRERLITEEYNELREALSFREMGGDKWLSECDLPETADAIADLIYVLIGTAHEMGIPLQDVWDRVQESNMTKCLPEVPGGKIAKPPGWVAPDIEGVLKAHGWEP